MYIGHVSRHFSDTCRRVSSASTSASTEKTQDDGSWLFRLVCKLLGI